MLRSALAIGLGIIMFPAVTAVAQSYNPALSADNTAWFVRYGVDAAGRNNRGDNAVQLRIVANPEGMESNPNRQPVKGTLYLYDNAEYDSQGHQRYKRRDGGLGKVTLTAGWITRHDTSSPNARRRPLGFELSGAYTDSKGRQQTLTVKGHYHPGRDLLSEDDDRVTIRVVTTERPLPWKQNGNGTGHGNKANQGNQGGLGPGQSQKLEPIPEKEIAVSVRCGVGPLPGGQNQGEYAVTPVAFLFQAPANDPCEEAPDTDILQEEPYDPMMEDPLFP